MKYYIPDCFWPVKDNGDYTSHEAISILNIGQETVTAQMTLYFEDRDKMEGFKLLIPAERTIHFHTCDLTNEEGVSIPRGVGYAAVISCDAPITVQYTRVDTTQPELTIATTMATVLS